MSLIPTPTVLDQGVLAGAEAAHNLASVLASQWQRFWQRDPAAVLAELNTDAARSAAIFALNSQAATVVNALLDALNDPRFPARAPTSMPTGWSFSPEAGFAYTPPAIEEPEPEA